MKQAIFLFFTMLLLNACNTEALKPQFKSIENIHVTELTPSKVSIEGDAVVYNPNPISIEMDAILMDVYINETMVGQVNQTASAVIKKKADFHVPLRVSFNPESLFKDKDNLLGLLESALNAYYNKKVDMHVQGMAGFDVKGIQFKVPFTYEEEILLTEE